MKFEEILGEIRKGRRFKHKDCYDWFHFTKRSFINTDDLLDDDWELEPFPREFWITKYSDGSQFVDEKPGVVRSGMYPPKLIETIHVREVL